MSNCECEYTVMDVLSSFGAAIVLVAIFLALGFGFAMLMVAIA